jgi:predicted lactoylglutathione lyase
MMNTNQNLNDVSIKTTVVSLPIRDSEKTLAFYKNVFSFSDAQIEEGIITLELPNLSLFLIEKDTFESYSRKAGRGSQFPDGSAGMVISCAIETKDDVDIILERAAEYGGTVSNKAKMDETSGGYTGYFSDPDGHLLELVCPQSNSSNDK